MHKKDYITLLRLKAAQSSDGGMKFAGWASTAAEDMAGDIVTPAGAKFELPLPLLWQHNHTEPVGAVTQAHVSPQGIRVTGKLTHGVAKALEAWELMKDGVLGLSVGFRALQSTPMANGGLRFDSWRWVELSLVSVPCNSGAKIDSVGKGLVSTAAPAPAPAPAPAAAAGVVDLEAFGRAVGVAIRRAT